ncbi:MAG: phosphoribosylanthranilate isomerase [Alphaproteobacteria bacterium]
MSVAAKVCGLSTPDAVDAAVAGGAAFVGFVFFPSSPRHVTPGKAAELAQAVPRSTQKVAVVVDPTDDELDTVLRSLDADLVQLHGQESPERVAAIRDRFGCGIVKAISVADAQDVVAAKRYESIADMVLFDAKPRAIDPVPGGNARSFDWSLLAGIEMELPWFLSGGLTADNLADAVGTTGARLVDVSSGVESTRGTKDPAMIAAFLMTAHRL